MDKDFLWQSMGRGEQEKTMDSAQLTHRTALGSAVLRRIVLTLAVAVIALSIFSMPAAVEQVGLDWSYQAALSYFLVHGFQYGRDVLYTYGPLGMLRAHVTAGYSLDFIFFGGLALSTALAIILVGLTWRGRSLLLVTFLAAQIAFFGSFQWDAPLLAGVISVSLLWTLPGIPVPFVLCASLLLPVFALIKFTHFTLSVACIFLTCAYLLVVGRRRDAALFVGTFVLGLAVLWFIVLRHDAGSFLQWLRGSAELASGFNDTMGGPPPERTLIFGALVLASAAALVIVQGLAAPQPLVGLTRSILFAAGTFVAWKQAFVRPDAGHMLTLPLTVLTLATVATSLVFTEAGDRRSRSRIFGVLSLLAVTISSGALMAELSHGASWLQLSPTRPFSVLAARIRLLLTYPEYEQFMRTNVANAEAKYALPNLTRQIGSATVDVYGDEIGIAILNHWNYRPRPVFQSFVAYTRYLAARNERYINSPAAPDFYVIRANLIDNQLPLSADGPAFTAILNRYEFMDAEAGYFLMRKRDEYRRSTVLAGAASLGQEITLPPGVGQELRYLRVTIGRTLLGRLRSFLLSPAHLRLSIHYIYGARHSFRLLREPAEDGVLLDTMTNAEISDGGARGNVPALLDGCAPLAASIRLDVAPQGASDFKTDFRYAIETQPRRGANQCP